MRLAVDDDRMSFIHRPNDPPVFNSNTSNTRLSFSGDATLYQDNNDSLTFGGVGDTISLGKCSNDTLYMIGKHQTAFFNYSANNTVIDKGQGLNLSIGVLFGHMDVYGFEHDLTAHVTLEDEAFSLASDGKGGTLLRLFGSTTVDFINDPHVTAARIHETHGFGA